MQRASRRRRIGLIALALLLALVPTSGLIDESYAASDSPTLQERRQMRDQERRLASEAEFTSKICQTQVTASIHWQSFGTRGSINHVAGKCDAALSGIERLCRESLDKVKGRIRHLRCGAGSKRAVNLSGSTLNYAVGPNASRADHEFVYKYLKRQF